MYHCLEVMVSAITGYLKILVAAWKNRMSRHQRKKPKKTVVATTIRVVAYTSSRPGQVTFLSSARTSTRKFFSWLNLFGPQLPASASQLALPSPPSPFSIFLASATAMTAPFPRPAPCCVTSPPKWQARRDSNPQPPVLETGAPPIELLACRTYFVSLCAVCLRQLGQYLLSS